ncbi:MAG: hypothetical protein FWF29_01220 [Treponema sp.]|nr:hypothetical protein [Treponema sp.]
MKTVYAVMGTTLLKILFILFSGIISGADIKTGRIPRTAFVLAFPSFFFLMLLLYEGFDPKGALTGMFTGLAIFGLAYFVSGRKLGLADVWYSALIGMVLGPWRWYGAICCACVSGVLIVVLFKKRLIPFIPCMAMGVIAVFLMEA